MYSVVDLLDDPLAPQLHGSWREIEQPNDPDLKVEVGRLEYDSQQL